MSKIHILQLSVETPNVLQAKASTSPSTHANENPPQLAIASHPEYDTLLEHTRSHLKLVPSLTPEDTRSSTSDQVRVFQTFLTPERLPQLNLDQTVFLLVHYFNTDHFSQGRNRAVLQEMIENGLISHAMAVLMLYLKRDDRPVEELVQTHRGWMGAFKLVYLIAFIVTEGVSTPDKDCARFCLRWRNALGPLLDALMEHEAIWSAVTPTTAWEAPMLDVSVGLVNLLHPHLLYVGVQLRSDTSRPTKASQCDPVTRSAARILAKLRGALLLVDGNPALDAEFKSRIAQTFDYMLAVLIRHFPNRSDVSHLTGLTMDEFVKQCIALLLPAEQVDEESVQCTRTQLRPLRTLLGIKTIPKSWVDAFARSRIFSLLVHRVRGLLLRMMAKDFSAACEAFKIEMTSKKPSTPLNAYLEILANMSVAARRHASWELYAEMSGPEALSVAEMAAFVNGGELEYVYWAIFLPGAFRDSESITPPISLFKTYTPSLRVLAARARLRLNEQPEAFPAMDRRFREQLLPTIKVYDGLYLWLESLEKSGSGGTRASSRTSSDTRGPLGTAYEEIRHCSVWELMYGSLPSGDDGQTPSCEPSFSPLPNEICAAVGCLGLELPQTVCGDCKKVYYCSRVCQRRNWKWHKPTCRQSRTT